MNKYLSENYGLFGTTPKKQRGLTHALRSVIASPVCHFVLFGLLMVWVGYLSGAKILPYSLQSGLATTFSYSIAAVGFCLLMGYSGLASLGTGGFIGIGCYAIYYVMGEAELSFGAAVLVALAIAVVVGLIVGFISLRIEGIYLVILTLGLSEILRNLFVAIQDSIYLSGVKILGIEIPRSASIYVVGFCSVSKTEFNIS